MTNIHLINTDHNTQIILNNRVIIDYVQINAVEKLKYLKVLYILITWGSATNTTTIWIIKYSTYLYDKK